MSLLTEKKKTNFDDEKLSKAGLKAFFEIAKLWKLSTEEQLLLLGMRESERSTLFNWKREPKKLPKDTLERISYILGIYKSLQILFPDEELADSWIKKSNSAELFQGQSALDIMKRGSVSDLFIVRQYLDAQRGGWC
ncbi:MAG: MbcA/ParS/Xre antitoxin family protein [Candidatus Caenarcaniphilales bacterium]|nr:MbcA/ParS/Xre antitoxin family protein [Candidatus Caenarcaniphilales bacterium]